MSQTMTEAQKYLLSKDKSSFKLRYLSEKDRKLLDEKSIDEILNLWYLFSWFLVPNLCFELRYEKKPQRNNMKIIGLILTSFLIFNFVIVYSYGIVIPIFRVSRDRLLGDHPIISKLFFVWLPVCQIRYARLAAASHHVHFRICLFPQCSCRSDAIQISLLLC